MKPIFLICGPSGCGKTWVAEQLHHKFLYVPHDEHDVKMYGNVLVNKAKISQRPVLGDCPFRVRVLIEELRKKKVTLIPVFIVESRVEVACRIAKRDGLRGITNKRLNRVDVLRERAKEMAAFQGTAKEVLNYLQQVKV